ncbi:MAG: hypothetical protein V8R40_12115 [Dysosmobacter sp.]
MQMRLAGISNMENRFYAAYTPLMERSVAASVLGQPPRRLEMQAWQRRQVTQHAPVLKDIPTDRGLTCDSAPGQGRRGREACGSLRKWRPGASSGAAGSPPASTAALPGAVLSGVSRRCGAVQRTGYPFGHVQAEKSPG